MSVAYDASGQGFNSGSVSYTHTPVGTPKGIIVFVTINASTTAPTAVTYGGVPMTFVASASDSAGEVGSCHAYVLGAGIPTGPQTVAATITGTPDTDVVSISVTAAKNTQLAGVGFAKVEGDAANPSATVTGISGASYGAAGLFSGLPSTASVTAGAGQTMRSQSDFGAEVSSVESSTSENASGDLTMAFTSISDDVAMVAVAIQEVSSKLFVPQLRFTQAVNRASTY